MEPDTESIGHERLFEAAEQLVTLTSDAAAVGGGWVNVSVDAGDERLKGFSQQEVDEGIRFLIRLGLIEVIP